MKDRKTIKLKRKVSLRRCCKFTDVFYGMIAKPIRILLVAHL